MKETSPQVSGSSTEPVLENQTGSTPVQSFNDSKENQSEIQQHEMNMTANDNGDDNISPPKLTNLQIEEQFVRDDITNELYMQLSSTIVLKWKKEMLYVPLDIENRSEKTLLLTEEPMLVQSPRLNWIESNNQPLPTSSNTMILPSFKSKSQIAS